MITIVVWLFGGSALLRLIAHEEQSDNAVHKENQRLSKPKPRLLSSSDTTTVTASVRGNLGPPAVVLNSGQNWLKDRWQAASDMHGTAIKGSQWIELTFDREIYVTKVVLDWEAAYAKNYRIEGRKLETTASSMSTANKEWNVLYDGGADSSSDEHKKLTDVEKYGQSPGVNTKTPLHIVHTVETSSLTRENQNDNDNSLQVLRIFIRRGAMGWGVSLWHIDVYGVDA
eukprot:CAMPEP_0195297914 /NCGR_PEP_ID=MMETSP0707-20130614/22367_1 /TAXON_ID=33640 /ORGANISM="Asterionellopsis glacialis, Strain CCMP134" /LENGTH=227 /DNA_ID=CAMNT_0040359841 /DNA_START=141 /DNA_END=824 /DNA_ORIENTATION=-